MFSQQRRSVFFAKVWLGFFFCKGAARSVLVFERFKCCKLQRSQVLERVKCCRLHHLLVLERIKCCQLQHLLVLERFKCCIYWSWNI